MNLVNELLAHFKITDWLRQIESGVTWFTTGNLDLRQLARIMRQAGARFVTITANELARRRGILPRIPLGS